MTEFTKEELEWLYQDISIAIVEDMQPDIAHIIRDKLKKMIENYCEHECDHAWVVARDEPCGIDDCVSRFFICIKCHRDAG